MNVYDLREMILDHFVDVLDPEKDEICISATENLVELIFNDKIFVITIEEKQNV